MPRRARVVYAGVPHHVTQRGNRRGQVFFSDADYQIYLHWLREYSHKLAVDVLAYCLMTNHVHLIVVPRTHAALPQVVGRAHARFAQRVNRMHQLSGHLWHSRYFASPLEGRYFWSAVRYVERNPVRAGMVARAEAYPWSSARAHCGLAADPVLATNHAWQDEFQGLGD